jgi:putative sigma-54 modulation protein
MLINFTGDGVAVNDTLRDYTLKKFKRLENRGDNITKINVIMNINKLQQIAEATLHVSGKDIHARSETSDMYNSIDELVDKLERQIIKHKEKIKGHHED